MLSITYLTCLFIAKTDSSAANINELYEEKLFIKPLESGHVYVNFNFQIKRNVDYRNSESTFQHFRLFPRSLGEIVAKYWVQELHLSLTQGFWRHDKWGYPIRDSSPGAELWTWFQSGTPDVSVAWKELSNALSGQFCASLNFIDETNTVQPFFAFRPSGVTSEDYSRNSSYLRYAALPQETVCTENLTPWKKLLPCDTKAGISTLLNAVHLFNTNYVSLAVDFQNVCENEKCTSIAAELQLSVSVVFEPPIVQGKQDWSFVKLFGTALNNVCPVALHTSVYVDITNNETGIPFSLTPAPSEIISASDRNLAAYYIDNWFTKSSQLNIAATYKREHIYWIIPPPYMHSTRYIAGYGQEKGGIHCTIYNNHPTNSQKIIYMEIIPWFLRLYIHTLDIQSFGGQIIPEHQYYQPARDRERPNHLELVFTLPPRSQTKITLEFERAFLKWTEYPPDANHGFYVGSAVISTVIDSVRNVSYVPNKPRNLMEKGKKHFLLLHTEILLVSLPTPDFSMPYNVICLACAVVTLAFGPIHNITTKRLNEVEEGNTSESKLSSLKKKLMFWKRSNQSVQNASDDSKKDR